MQTAPPPPPPPTPQTLNKGEMKIFKGDLIGVLKCFCENMGGGGGKFFHQVLTESNSGNVYFWLTSVIIDLEIEFECDL